MPERPQEEDADSPCFRKNTLGSDEPKPIGAKDIYAVGTAEKDFFEVEDEAYKIEI